MTWFLYAPLVVVSILLVLLVIALFVGDPGKGPIEEKDEPLAPASPFVVQPYVQLGDNPNPSLNQSLEILWTSTDVENIWGVHKKSASETNWQPAASVNHQLIAIPGLTAQRQYTAKLTGLTAGQDFDYRVLLNGVQVFAARARAAKLADVPQRFVVFGDVSTGKRKQKKVAFQIHKSEPDFVVIAGDIVYEHGRVSEYLEKYFPVFNAEYAENYGGAPLIRSTLTMAAPGNHDVGTPNSGIDRRSLDRFADLLGYYIFWSQPLNGPAGTVSGANTPALEGEPGKLNAFYAAAGAKYPRMANYSFDYGNAHWLMLDANPYMDWTDPGLRAWIEADLGASTSRWKFVCFHQPCFTSDKRHGEEQQMRVLVDIFEKYAVDIVFSGHAHHYERSYPLRFKMEPLPANWRVPWGAKVQGELALDKSFDGKTKTRPEGIIYVVSGAGGAKLREDDWQYVPSEWQPFTYKVIGDEHSFTVCDVEGDKLTLRQISEDGHELDVLVLTK